MEAQDGALAPAFMPSKANADCLSAELPHGCAPAQPDALCTVLYPASSKAQNTLQAGLERRPFAVTRLNTYDTVRVTECSDAERAQALRCPVVSIGSPSALKACVSLMGESVAKGKAIACIGSTSGEAALRLGFDADCVFWDDQPGMEGWVRSIRAALRATGNADAAESAQAVSVA